MRQILCAAVCNASQRRWTRWSYHLTNYSCSRTARQMPCTSMSLQHHLYTVLCIVAHLFHQSISVDCFSYVYTVKKPHLPENSRPRCHKSCPLPFFQYPSCTRVTKKLGAAISCTKSSQMACLIHTVGKYIS